MDWHKSKEKLIFIPEGNKLSLYLRIWYKITGRGVIEYSLDKPKIWSRVLSREEIINLYKEKI